MRNNKRPMTEGKTEIEFTNQSSSVIKYIGKWIYNEGDGAWTMMRLRKWLVDHKFPQLKNREINSIYQIIIADYYKDLTKELDELEKLGAAVPMILSIGKEKE